MNDTKRIITHESTGINGAGAENLIRHVLGEVDGYLVTWTGRQKRLEVPDASENELIHLDQRSWKYPERLAEAVAYLHAESDRGRDAYFAVSPFREAGNRRGENVAEMIQTLRLDFDGYKTEKPENFPDPTAYAISSPGSYHMYFRLSRPVPKWKAAELSRRLARWTGSDVSLAANTTVLRVPRTRNYKRYPEVHEVTAEITGMEPYDPDELEALLPPEPKSRREPREGYDGPEDAGFALEDWLERHPEAEDAIIEERRDEKARVKYAVVCPWIEEHTGGDRSGTYLGQFPEGALFFHCNHGHCEERDWKEYRSFYEGEGYEVVLVDEEDFEPEGYDTPDTHDTHDTMTLGSSPLRTTPTGDAGDTYDAVTPHVAPLRYRGAGAVPFPLQALPPSLQRYLEEAAHAKEAPVEFIALPVLAALGVGIGASRWFRIERSWEEYATLYTAVVALPASGKSPAEDAAMLPVYRQSKILNHRYKLALAEYKEKHAAWEQEAQEARKKKRRVPPEPEKPTKPRLRVGDATVEALHVKMAENPRGLVLARDELAGFFNSLNQYKGKGSDRQFWLSQHSGKVAPVDRKTDDEAYDVDYPCVFVVGSIQPEKLHVLDIEAGDGMVERFLFAWPDARMQPDSERDISLEAEQEYLEIWNRLYALEMGEDEYGSPAPRDVPLATGAIPAWRAYRRAIKRSADEPGVSPFMRGVIGKMKAHFHRFALILALVRTVEDGEAVEEVRTEELDNAWKLAEYFVAQSYRVYTEFKKENKDDLLAYALGRFLEENGEEWEGTATELFNALAELGFIQALPKKPDALTQAVRKAARNTPALSAEKGPRSAEARSIVLKREYPEDARGGVGAGLG